MINQDSWTVPQDTYTSLPYPQDPYTDDLFSQQTVVNPHYAQGQYVPSTWADGTRLDKTLVNDWYVNDSYLNDSYVNDSYLREDQPIWYGQVEHTVTTAVTDQRRRYGGIKLGSALFGLLTAVSMAMLLAVLAAVAVAGFAGNDSASLARIVGADLTGASVGAAAALLLIVAIAFYSGGYVAARMARFSGAAHGVAVWVWAVSLTTLTSWVAAGQVDRYNLAVLVDALNAGSVEALPRLSISQDFLARVVLVAVAILALTALAAAVVGGAAGDRYHRRIDRVTGAGTQGTVRRVNRDSAGGRRSEPLHVAGGGWGPTCGYCAEYGVCGRRAS